MKTNHTYYKQFISLFILFLFNTNIYSQTLDLFQVEYQNIQIPHCSSIDLNLNTEHRITFQVRFEKPYFGGNTDEDFSNLRGTVSVNLSAGGTTITLVSDSIDTNYWIVGGNFQYFQLTGTIVISNSQLDTDGGILYVSYDTESGNEYLSCDYLITRPKFRISPSNTTVSCNSSSAKNFGVNNVNNSPGTLEYHWSVGNGWKRNGNVVHNFTTTSSMITLVPYQYPPSDVHVTPYLDGVPYEELTSTVSLSDFNPNNAVVGASSICDSADYHLQSSLGAGQSVFWHVSDSSVATITQNGDNATLTAVSGQYGTVTVTAVIANACQQISNKTFDVYVGIPNVPVNSHHVYGWDNVPMSSYSSMYTNVIEGATSYLWTISPLYSGGSGTPAMFETYYGNTTTTITTSNNRVYVDWGTRSTSYVINCKAINSCGQQGIGYKVVFVFNQSNNPCGGGLGDIKDDYNDFARFHNDKFTVSIFPNPSKGGDINVTKIDPNLGTGPCNNSMSANKKAINRKIKNKVTIYDIYGNLVFDQFFYTNEFKISTSNLKKGTYFLNIIDNLGHSKKSSLILE